MLAIVGFLLAAAQENIQQQAEEQRAQAQRDAEEQRAQDEALQAYLEGMGDLLLDKGLLSSQEGDEVSTLARARTLTVLGRVDGARKRSVLEFLQESQLIQKDQPIVSLDVADLSDAYLFRLYLGGVDLSGSTLNQVDLRGANLSGADLSGANLNGATGITTEELEDSAYSLSGTAMPDGSVHD